MTKHAYKRFRGVVGAFLTRNFGEISALGGATKNLLFEKKTIAHLKPNEVV